ncbi:hypothetical protein WAK64_15360 [Bacillus spongiae]|uniref:DUF3953 domain-containing protein n=1 Tax=Bacillus spongiae TaxID=2683610 RepID=A0ABU8HGY8_9BACI
MFKKHISKGENMVSTMIITIAILTIIFTNWYPVLYLMAFSLFISVSLFHSSKKDIFFNIVGLVLLIGFIYGIDIFVNA